MTHGHTMSGWPSSVWLDSVLFTSELSEVSKRSQHTRVCDPTIHGILIVSHIKKHTQTEQGFDVTPSLLCIPCKHTVHCIYNWRQFSPRWWRWCCVYVVDLRRPRQTPPHLGCLTISQQGSVEFLCNSHASPVFSKHCASPCVCASDPFQWEASSCFCCWLRNSITLSLWMQTNRAVGLAGHRTKPGLSL